jgi:hypothetical protein
VEGETDLAGARRELSEELHLEIPLSGPVHTVTSTFDFKGKPLTSIDVFFLGRHESQGVELHFATKVERVAMKEFRWWTIEELERSSETVFSQDLAKVLQSFISRKARI